MGITIDSLLLYHVPKYATKDVVVGRRCSAQLEAEHGLMASHIDEELSIEETIRCPMISSRT